jgi:hypothetical protein
METKEFVCHGGYGDADNGKERPCPVAPCTATVKSGYDPCCCLLFGDDGMHIPNWEDAPAVEEVSRATRGPLRTTKDILREAEAVDSIAKELSPAATVAHVYERMMAEPSIYALAAWIAKQLGK